MKRYIVLWAILAALYASYHVLYREIGGPKLYRISDGTAFELTSANEFYNGLSVRGYRETPAVVRLACGACAVTYDRIDMPRAAYMKGDWVYSDAPGNAAAKTDILNVRTGQAIDVLIPEGAPSIVDLATLPEYRDRGLVADPALALRADYVKTNFAPLSTFTGSCVLAHVIFGLLALFILFPRPFLALLEGLARGIDQNDSTRYSGG